MQILLTAVLAAAQILSSGARLVRSEPVLVTAVLDGDTIAVSTLGHVRLLGIDAPEISHGLDTAAPFAREARDRLSGLVLNRWIYLEYEGAPLDVYGRRLAYVVTGDGQFVNAALVRDGLARVLSRGPLARLEELRHAEAEAQTARRGIWGAVPSIPPRPPEYTRRSRAIRSTARKPHTSSTHRRKKKKKT